MVPGITRRYSRFLIITTVTADDSNVEDTINSLLKQQYEQRNYEVVVVGDKLTPIQKIKLAQYPITLLCTNLENGTKGQAQRYAIQNMHSMKIFDNVILLDPDETVLPDFLLEVNKVVQSGQHYFQIHRKPQFINSVASILSATMEEINNSIFRKGHVVLGMPSSLIGSAIALDYSWFKKNVHNINNIDEEKSLEALLLKDQIFVDYVDDVYVYYRPVASHNAIIQQRKRWMESKLATLLNSVKQILPSIIHWNKNVIDKIIVWMMIPKIILMGVIIGMGLIIPFIYFTIAIKWWILFFVVTFAFALATPDYIVQDERWAKSFIQMPVILGKSLLNLLTHNIFTKGISAKARKTKSNK